MGLRQGSGLCSSSSRKYPGTEIRIRNAIETITADMLQTVWNELDSRVDVCRITKDAHVRYVRKPWGVVLLNKNKHILLSQVYCV